MGRATSKGRPVKDGLDYFPFEVAFFSDKKTRRLKAKFGVFGVMVYLYLTAEIYKDKGYYLQLNSGGEYDSNITFDDLVFFIFEYFNEPGTSEEMVKDIIFYCMEIGLLSKALYKEHLILTSKGIQTRFIKIKRRPRIKPEFIVPDLEEKDLAPPMPVSKDDFGDMPGNDVVKFDEAFEKMFKDEVWLMKVSGANSLSKEKTIEYLKKFKKIREGDGDSYKNIYELKRYFNNWVRKVVEAEKPNNEELKEFSKYRNLKPAK